MPRFEPVFTWGNVMSTASILAVAVGAFFVTQAKTTENTTEIIKLDDRITANEKVIYGAAIQLDLLKEVLGSATSDMKDLSGKIDRLNEQLIRINPPKP